MSVLDAIVDAAMANGCSAEQLASLVKAYSKATSAAAEEAREKAAEKREKDRQRQIKHRMSRSVTAVTRDTRDSPFLSNEINGHVTLLADEAEKPALIGSKKKEGKEKGEKKKASRLPSNWDAPIEWIEEAVAAGLSQGQAFSEACKMRDWSLSAPGGAKLDWHAAWRNWYRRRVEELPKNKLANGNPLLDALRSSAGKPNALIERLKRKDAPQ